MHPASRSRSSSLPRGPMMPRPSGQPPTSAIGRLTCAHSHTLEAEQSQPLRAIPLLRAPRSPPQPAGSEFDAAEPLTTLCTQAEVPQTNMQPLSGVTLAKQAHCRAPLRDP